MGLNLSKRVEKALTTSPEFAAACDSEYDYRLDLAEHAFPGVRPYQLLDAATRLHSALSISLPPVKRWVNSAPSQAQVDAALRRAVKRDAGEEDLNRPEFKTFATELFRDAILCGAGMAVMQGVPVGAAGIAGVGLLARAGREVVGRVMGVYAIGVAAAVYLTLT